MRRAGPRMITAKTSGVRGEELRLQKKKKSETPAADLHASTGSLHIIKARGCFQWLRLLPSPHRLHRAPTRWFISAVVLNVFPRLERWELMRFTHVCQETLFFWRRGSCNSSEKSDSRSCLVSQTTQRHRSAAGWQNQWWMFTFTLSLNIPRYCRHSFCWMLRSVIVLFNLIWALQALLEALLRALVCCVLMFLFSHVNFKVMVACKGQYGIKWHK